MSRPPVNRHGLTFNRRPGFRSLFTSAFTIFTKPIGQSIANGIAHSGELISILALAKISPPDQHPADFASNHEPPSAKTTGHYGLATLNPVPNFLAAVAINHDFKFDC
jgi:hypothetical protein